MGNVGKGNFVKQRITIFNSTSVKDMEIDLSKVSIKDSNLKFVLQENEETRFVVCPKCKKRCMFYSKGIPKEHEHIGCGGKIFL